MLGLKRELEKIKKRIERRKRETGMEVRVERMDVMKPKKWVEEEKDDFTDPIKTTGSGLNGGLSRKLRQCSVAIFRPDGEGYHLYNRHCLPSVHDKKNIKRENLENNRRR